MSTQFPTALDTFPSAATLAAHTLSVDPHSSLHGNLGDALRAVQVCIGVTGAFNFDTAGAAAAAQAAAVATAKAYTDSGVANAEAYTDGRLDSYVPTTTTVNGHALSANVVVSAADITTGQLPTAQLPTGNWVGNQNGESDGITGATQVNLNFGGSSNGTFVSTDGTGALPSVTLPGAGTYVIIGYGRVSVQTSAADNGFINFRLYNTTDSAAVANSECMGCLNNSTARVDATALILAVVTVAASKTIQLQAARNLSSTWTLALVSSDANGRTKLAYFRIA